MVVGSERTSGAAQQASSSRRGHSSTLGRKMGRLLNALSGSQHFSRSARRKKRHTTCTTAFESLEARRVLSATSAAVEFNVDMAATLESREVLVQFDNEVAEARIIAQEIGASRFLSATDQGGGLYEVEVASHSDIQRVITELNAMPGVAYAEPNFVIQVSSTTDTHPNPNLDSLWALENEGQTGGTYDADIDASAAWDVTTGSDQIVVAVIDTGIDYTHPRLRDNIWRNTGEVAGDGLDNDGNGYIDDVMGFDFANEDADPFDAQSHGTHVAGTILDVAPSVTVMPLKIFGDNGEGTLGTAVRAIRYAVDNGAQISNNSWGIRLPHGGLRFEISRAAAANHVFVASAGNSAKDTDVKPHFPSGYSLPNIISVAATNHDDQLADYSNYGAVSVDIAAPGGERGDRGILSSIPGGGYGFKSGTSMAAPHVAGAAALVLSQNPELQPEQVIDALTSAVDKLPQLNGKVRSGGRLNVAAAINAEPTDPPTFPIIDRAIQIVGTPLTDTAIVTREGDYYVTTLNDVSQRNHIDHIDSIFFDGQDGNDRFTNRTSMPSVAYGGKGRDRLTGGSGQDKLYGQEGHDRLRGRGDNDILRGGKGNDRVFGGGGNDFLDGGPGRDDLLKGGAGIDRFRNGEVTDQRDVVAGQRADLDFYSSQLGERMTSTSVSHGALRFHNTPDGETTLVYEAPTHFAGVDRASWTLVTADGEHINMQTSFAVVPASVSNGNLTVNGTSGHDTILVSQSGTAVTVTVNGFSLNFPDVQSIEINGGIGNDTIRNRTSLPMTARGDSGADRLFGGDGMDWLDGGTGNDFIAGAKGDDRIYGGFGNDEIYGGHGNDRLYGQDGHDSIFGERGADDLWGGSGDDFMHGGVGNDRLDGGFGNDQLRGDSGDDYVQGSYGNDIVEGGDGDDNVRGGSGNDLLYGNRGNDLLSGGSGEDRMFGGRGRDQLYGDSGRDYMDGGHGDDTMDGRSDSWWARRKRRFRGWLWR